MDLDTPELSLKEIASGLFKFVGTALVSMLVYFVSQLNASMGALTALLQDVNKRVTVLESYRELNYPRFTEMERTVQKISAQMDVLSGKIDSVQVILDRNKIH